MYSLILIPPSEGKAIGGECDPWAVGASARSHPLFESRLRVVDSLTRLARSGDQKGLSRSFGVRGDLLVRAIDSNSSIDDALTLPAIDRYDGVLYQYLDAASLGKRACRSLDTRVRIFSGLWGVLSPQELVPDYRLKMSASLPDLAKLSSWWRSEVTEYLWGGLKRGATVWNLLPNEHAAAWDPPSRENEVTAVFLSPGSDGKLRAVAHWNKALKGALVRHLVQHPSVEPEDLADWEHPEGLRLDRNSLRVAGDSDESGSRARQLRFVPV
ncbi:MAG: YaaA family protein [Microthrixaceae bacterium]